MNRNTEIIMFVKNESILESAIKDIVTLTSVTLCVYISKENMLWSFITGTMFIMIVVALVKKMLNMRICFRSKKEMQEWLDSQE